MNAGRPLRILVDPGGPVETLTAALGPLVAAHDADAPVGFVAETPRTAKGLHTLLDRSGILLARCRDERSLVDQTAALIENLAAHHAGASPFSLRAVETPSGLAVAPLWAMVGLASAKRALERRGARIVPGLRVWLDPSGRAVSIGGSVPTRLVTLNGARADEPTPAQVVQVLASTAAGWADRRNALDAATAAVERGLEAVFVTDSRPAGLAAALAA